MVADAMGKFKTKNLTVDRNGNNIAGAAENLTVDKNGNNICLPGTKIPAGYFLPAGTIINVMDGNQVVIGDIKASIFGIVKPSFPAAIVSISTP